MRSGSIAPLTLPEFTITLVKMIVSDPGRGRPFGSRLLDRRHRRSRRSDIALEASLRHVQGECFSRSHATFGTVNGGVKTGQMAAQKLASSAHRI